MGAAADVGSAVVLYPSPGMGHLVSMVELGRVFVGRGLLVTVVVLDTPYSPGSTAAFIDRASAASPGIAFHRLPPVTLPRLETLNHELLVFEQIRLSDANLLRYLKSTSPRALVVDFFCASGIGVAAELGLPAFVFFTSGAGVLATFLHLPTVDEEISESFEDLGCTPISFPGVPPIPANHMPTPMLHRHDASYSSFVGVAKRLTEARGIIVNTFEAIESEAVKAIRAGLCTPPGVGSTPPLYCIGPLITPSEEGGDADPCLAWLDSQPRASVVFLCFGSMGRFSAAQLGEVATGLERSGQRFLWVVRSPPSGDPSKRFEKPAEPELDSLLPAGFRERTGERGMVVRSWAPQARVLSHSSVGGFVTHLGWNSTLEAICAGVPMVGWPQYAEQRVNKVLMVDGQGLAGVVEGYDGEMVTAAEVEARLRWLMVSEAGEALRARAAAARAAAAAAKSEGGSSFQDLERLTRVLNA